MLSQFTQEVEGQITLKNLDFYFPKDVYPVGRLDADSEGLLLLTNDKSLNQALLHPDFAHSRTYYAQVEGEISTEAMAQLAKGVALNINGKTFVTRSATIQKLANEPILPPRNPPIRFRKNIPTSWISLTLIEGKNRQVRRMTAAVGYPTLRLVRVQLGEWKLGEMQPGEVKEITVLHEK